MILKPRYSRTFVVPLSIDAGSALEFVREQTPPVSSHLTHGPPRTGPFRLFRIRNTKYAWYVGDLPSVIGQH